MSAPDWLAQQASARPEHPALVTPDDTLTFRELDARATACARHLRARGVVPGDRVAAVLPNGVPLVTLIHAAPRAGAALVLVDPRLPAPEAAACVRLTAPRVVVDASESVAAAGDAGGAPDIHLAAPHTIVFSSGTSGTPKAVVLTAGNHLASALGSAARLGVHRDDRWLACLPLTHVGGLSIVLRGAITGTTVVLHPRFDAEGVARALAEDGVSLVSLVPTMLARLLPVLRTTPALRVVLLGGAAAPAELIAAAQARGLPLARTYGLTEAASQVATAAPGDAAVLPLVHTRVRIVRADGTEAAAGEDGDICLAGPTLTPGYLAPDGTITDPKVDGWFRTGDRGRRAADGALTVLGRRDDVIVTGGENVDPVEVESALLACPGVAEAGVAALPDTEWGQVVAAWIVPHAGATPALDALRAACRDRLAPYQLPRRLVVVNALPRTATGKLRRAALRAGWPARDG